MPIGPIIPGSDTTITPDAGTLGYASLTSPSPTMPVLAEDFAELVQALLNVQQFLLELVTGTNATHLLGRIGTLEIVGPTGKIQIDTTALIDIMSGGEVRYESGGVSNYKLGAVLNLLLGAHLLWAKGSLPVIQTTVDVNQTSGGPAGYVFQTGTVLGMNAGSVFGLSAGTIANNDTDLANTKTFVNVGPAAGFIDNQISGIDADHTYFVGSSWADKIHISTVTGTRKYAFSHTESDLVTPIQAGRRVLVTFGNIAGASGALELRDGSLAGTVLITLVAGAGYMSAELTFDGSAFYVSDHAVRL